MKRKVLLLTGLFMLMQSVPLFALDCMIDSCVPIIIPSVKESERDNPEFVLSKYIQQIADFDVSITEPNGYRSIRMGAPCRQDFFSLSGHGMTYRLGLQSKDENAVILLPTLLLNVGTQSLQQCYILAEELRWFKRDDGLEINNYIEVISEKDMSRYSNADTAVVYEFEVDAPKFMERYNHCVGVYLRKYGHPGMVLRLMLDDEGYKNKDKYLREMLDAVRFGDSATSMDIDEKRITRSDLAFPHAHFCNHIYDIPERIKQRWKAENDSLNRLDAVRIK